MAALGGSFRPAPRGEAPVAGEPTADESGERSTGAEGLAVIFSWVIDCCGVLFDVEE